MSIVARTRKYIALLASMSALILASVLVGIAPAHASSGTVTCASSAVVGMWVDVSGGSSGWASLSSTSNPNIKSWSYDTGSKKWSANIGCGGTPQNWDKSVHLGKTSKTSGTIICDDVQFFGKCTIN